MKSKDIRDDLLRGRLSRRDLNKMLAAAGLSFAMLPLGRAAKAASTDCVYFTWTGYDVPEFFPAYIAKEGGPPSTPIFADEEEALQKLRAGFEADLTHPCSGRIRRWREADVIQSFDPGRLTQWPDLFDSLKSINGANDDGKQWFAPVDWGNTSVLYRTDLFDLQGQPESWTMLWDERYKGRLSIGEDVTDTGVICGLLAGAKDLFNMSDADLEKVRALLVKQKPLIRFYWSDNTAMEQAMSSGELVASSAWNSSYVTLKNQGVPVAYAQPKEGILSWCCGLVMNKGAKHEELAYALMDAILSPEVGEFMLTDYGYGHSNKKAFEALGAEKVKELGLPSNPEEMFATSIFGGENTRVDALQAIFEEVKAGL